MCGILGHASARPITDRAAFSKALATVCHRGPDDTGEWLSPDARVLLGHRRLAVLDLSPQGHQPMGRGEGEATIVFNGEIYNYSDLRGDLSSRGHQFHTASDTEVILAAYREWGVDCIARLNGMFAFALFDPKSRRLLLARDRAGEKPLYYHAADSELRFASELKALMTDSGLPRTIDRGALDCYLAMGYVPGELCILRGVRKLPPAHALTFDIDGGEIKVWRYWTLPELEAGTADQDDLAGELEALLEDAVRRQLVADVPVGVLLSGGVDSSLVTAMAVRAAPRVKTFTVRFPGSGEHDETEHARLIARHFGTEHLELEAEPGSVDLLDLLARQYDEPMADSSMIPTYLVSRLVRQHCTVVLGGDGGDELFGGYTHYRRLLWLQRATGRVPLFIRRGAARAAVAMLPVELKGRNWLDALAADFERDVPPVEGLFDARYRCRLMAAHDWLPTADAYRAARVPVNEDLLQRATRMDFENYLPEDILVKVDRASMLNSLEVRAPFLDHRVVEFAFGRVPSEQKATAGELKILLKKLCARLLPAEFDQRRKQGFSIPLGKWLESGPWLDRFREVLLDDSALFDERAVRALLDDPRARRNHGERLFALTLFELWRREYGVSL